jgi:hypothetical protein
MIANKYLLDLETIAIYGSIMTTNFKLVAVERSRTGTLTTGHSESNMAVVSNGILSIASKSKIIHFIIDSIFVNHLDFYF